MQLKSLATTLRRQRGLSLIECLVTVAVAAVASGAVLPGFQQTLERRHLDGTAAQLQTDLQLARSHAAALNRSLRISYQNDASGSCYVIHSGSVGDCLCAADGTPVCSNGAEALRSMHIQPGGVQLRSNVTSMVLDPAKGTVSPTGTVRLTGREGNAVHVIVNIMGRVRKCTPGGSVAGYPSC